MFLPTADHLSYKTKPRLPQWLIPQSLVEAQPRQIVEVVTTNLLGALLCTRAAVQLMVRPTPVPLSMSRLFGYMTAKFMCRHVAHRGLCSCLHYFPRFTENQ